MFQYNESLMKRALELAQLGNGKVMPNPLVGCVIEHNGKIIGEGYHKEYGKPHAEVNAIHSVKNKELLKESTLYVTLEPCSHFGKTPPCADLIVSMQIPRVVVGSLDPNPLVAGKGINRLKDNHIEVISGVLDTENKYVNRRFFTFHQQKRPYIILKWAQSADGFIDKLRSKENTQPQWITDDYCRMLVHKWRSEEGGILVGANTVVMDNPKLNVREWNGNNPHRIVLANNTIIPLLSHICDCTIPTTIFTNIDQELIPNKNLIIEKLSPFNIPNLLNRLFQLQIQSIFVEGGAETFKHFINENLWDEARVFIGKMEFKAGIKSPYLVHKNETINFNLNNQKLSILINNLEQ